MYIHYTLYLYQFNNNNNNNRVYTPLSERCSQSRVFTTYQIQISEKKIHADIAIPTELQMYIIK